MNNQIKLGKKIIKKENPTYFIADIASNHDGSLSKAKDLIYLCSESGADAAKFQNFSGKSLICDSAFNILGNISHQTSWKQSVFDSYDKVSVPLSWTEELKITCDKAGVDYFTSPYDIDIIDALDKFVCAWKVGSGDITYHDIILKMAKSNKPIIIATGASTIEEVRMIINQVKNINDQIILMQCNTNYTGSNENFNFINLNVLKLYEKEFPNLILGLSDHTPKHSTVLGAISLGARVIEKHFTDKNTGNGPDHKFSMNPSDWKDMVERSRELENSFGFFNKKIEPNEKETVIIQRRGIRVSRDLKKGHKISLEDLTFLRPCAVDCIPPYKKDLIIGKTLKKDLNKDDPVNFDCF